MKEAEGFWILGGGLKSSNEHGGGSFPTEFRIQASLSESRYLMIIYFPKRALQLLHYTTLKY